MNHKHCLKKEQKIGKLTLKDQIVKVENNGQKRIYWKCKCECGKDYEGRQDAIARGKIVSCGCYNPSEKFRGAGHYKWCGYKDISGNYFNVTKRNAAKRGFEFTATIEEVWELYVSQNKKCALTGRDILLSPNSQSYKNNWRDEQTASLDRKDSSIGYMMGNIQWIHKDLQKHKWNFSNEYFRQLCKIVAENNND